MNLRTATRDELVGLVLRLTAELDQTVAAGLHACDLTDRAQAREQATLDREARWMHLAEEWQRQCMKLLANSVPCTEGTQAECETEGR